MSDDGFEVKNGYQLRVLRLNGDVYIQDVYRDPATQWKDDKLPAKGANFKFHESITPTDETGQPMKSIPFWFIGSQNNDIEPEDPNLYDIASLNVAHYRNSADYEEGCYIHGQATPVVTGLTEEWFTNVLKGKLTWGSVGGIPLPAEADCKLLQAEANTMIKEAMSDKVDQMRSLGAKLLEDRKTQRTATESKQDNAAEGSVLSSCANNVSTQYQEALKHCARLMGASDAEVEFALNTDFDVANLTPEEVGKAIEAWGKGAITFKEMRNTLRRFGWATEDDDKAALEIEKAQIAEMEKLAKHSPEFNTPDPVTE
jgi:hypothetical protein